MHVWIQDSTGDSIRNPNFTTVIELPISNGRLTVAVFDESKWIGIRVLSLNC